MTGKIGELNPPPRLLMGPGPITCDPRVLRALSMPLLGQFDPAFTAYMNEVMALYRRLYQTENHWTFLVDGTARAGIEAILVSLIATVFAPERIEAAIRQHRPRVLVICQGDTSTTMAQPLDEIGAICRRHDVILYVDATATLGGMALPVDRWQIDAVSAGLQKCLSGPPGSSPITFNQRVVDIVAARKHVEAGIRPADYVAGNGVPIQSNYFDLAMLMDYWGESRLNHHTEAASMLYAAHECARIVLAEGLENCLARHRTASAALTAGLTAMGLELFGDQAHKMPNVTGVIIPGGVDGETVRRLMLEDFGIEIGSSFGPLKGRIWRIGTMGYVCRKENLLHCLGALEATLRQCGFRAPPGAGVDAALAVYRAAVSVPACLNCRVMWL